MELVCNSVKKIVRKFDADARLKFITDWTSYCHNCEATNIENVTAVKKGTTFSCW